MRRARERSPYPTRGGEVSRPGAIPGPTVIVRMKRERDATTGKALGAPVKSLSIDVPCFS
jgi:hypothetical protein